jgi:hypothetical protein
MRRSCPFHSHLPFPFTGTPQSTPINNEVDTLSSDVTLALKHAALFMNEFVQRGPHFNLLIPTSFPSPQTSESTTTDFSNITN